jgi:agmatinase
VPGTRTGPHEILVASSHMELWDEETQTDVHSVGIYTLPEMEFPFASMDEVVDEIRRVAAEIVNRGKFPIILGGEHSVTPPVVAAVAAKHKGLSVLQIDAHADLRDSFMGTPHNHACAMRRTLEHAPLTQVGIRSLSSEEAADIASLKTRIFYDFNMRQDPSWMDRVVDSLSDTVYITIDVDGFDPAIMPSTGTPEPGGLSWYEGLGLLRRVIERRTVVGCDIVELSPMAGNAAPNFLCAKLLYKILSYRFGAEIRK